MPLPIETLLRVHDSPVPTQTFCAFDGSMAIAPMDCTGCSSKTGLKVVPPSVDFHTPPLADPTNRVSRPEGSSWPASAEIRPLIAAEPMLRAPSPEMMPASTTGDVDADGAGVAAGGVLAAAHPAAKTAPSAARA